jgi:hypothetical protein
MRGTNLKFALALVLSLALASNAWASSVQRFSRDIKVPTQAMMEHQQWATPIVATTNYIVTTNAGPTSAAALDITTFAHQPDYARNLTITPTGTTGDVESCVITVTGTNYFDATITEDFTFSADASTAQTGNKAFKTVSNVHFPASCESGGYAATWVVGVGSKLGLKRCTDVAGKYVFSIFDGAYETSRGTLAATTAVIGSNTFTPNGTMNGSKVVDLYFIQDFSCAP